MNVSLRVASFCAKINAGSRQNTTKMVVLANMAAAGRDPLHSDVAKPIEVRIKNLRWDWPILDHNGGKVSMESNWNTALAPLTCFKNL